jgi:hypothetical protein
MIYIDISVNGSLTMSFSFGLNVPSVSFRRPYNIIRIISLGFSPLKVRVTLQVSQTNEHIMIDGMVCDDQFNHNSLLHACQSVGRSPTNFSTDYFWIQDNSCQIEYASQRSSVPCQFILDELYCGNNTKSLSQCTHSGLFISDCNTNEHVRVECS